MSMTLSALNFYPAYIIDCYNTCISALKTHGYPGVETNCDFDDAVLDDLDDIGDWHDLTNSIMAGILSTTVAWLKDKGYEGDYYVNGADTHLYIDSEEYCGEE